MNTTGWIIAGVAAYFLFFSGRSTPLVSSAPAPPATASVAPSGTTITIPGVGTYTNVGGGQAVSITLDGNLVQSLFGGQG